VGDAWQVFQRRFTAHRSSQGKEGLNNGEINTKEFGDGLDTMKEE
jgi:hypothetical protein